MTKNPMLYTVGHSNHALETFLGLLREHRIDVLVDTRSQPVSRYLPHFNKEELAAGTQAAGVRYLFLGAELGGRPEGRDFYDEEGHVRYDSLAASPRFQEGVGRLERGLERYRVAIMCSEEDPAVCHRYLLIARVMRERGVPIAHIRGDGSLQSDAELQRAEGSDQPLLFADFEEKKWRSLRPILKARPEEEEAPEFMD